MSLFGLVEVPYVGGNAPHERGRVVGGIAAHGHDATVAHVEHDGSRTRSLTGSNGTVFGRHERGQRPIDHVLNGSFDGEAHVGSIRGAHLCGNFHYVALGVDHHAARSMVTR